MNKIKIGINGLGRIGKGITRLLLENDNLELTIINCRSGVENAAYLVNYDSIYGPLHPKVTVKNNHLIYKNKKIKIVSASTIEEIDWSDVDYVVESTGKFRTREQVTKYLTQGAKRVIISAPAKDIDITLNMGINEELYNPKKHFLISNASCTTNCLSPIVKVILENWGIKRGFMSTIHAYTSDQRLLDGSHKKDPRRGRAANLNIIPTSTGASKAVGIVIPKVKGKLQGIAYRVPTPTASLTDLVVETEKETTKEEVNRIFTEYSKNKLKNILAVTTDPVTSSDFIGSTYSVTIDLPKTEVINKSLIKILGWYDNEYGYNCRIVDLLEYMGRKES